MAIFCDGTCAEPEFANGMCLAHYAGWINRLAEASPAARRELEDAHAKRWVEMRLGEKADRSKHLRRGGVPALCIAALQQLRQTEPVAAALELAQGRSKLLLLLGRAGTGKSLAMAAACAEIAHKWPWDSQPGGGIPPVPFLFVQASVFEALEQPPELERAKLLCIDEMGREANHSVQRMVSLLIARHGAGKLTALASNLPAAEWKARYGEALADRIRADGRVVQLAGKSERVARDD